ncbi:hypothetical protein CSUI_000040 [Cystoisospora suis]|uniref:Uncharacterized protein n=1 Tax=Cystoisospora suis TaxID=483139 RepID=A0A2C6KQ31_9APIC|nr:hypothetical protein CSUI_000040 [Cystoisospora suis]
MEGCPQEKTTNGHEVKQGGEQEQHQPEQEEEERGGHEHELRRVLMQGLNSAERRFSCLKERGGGEEERKGEECQAGYLCFQSPVQTSHSHQQKEKYFTLSSQKDKQIDPLSQNIPHEPLHGEEEQRRHQETPVEGSSSFGEDLFLPTPTSAISHNFSLCKSLRSSSPSFDPSVLCSSSLCEKKETVPRGLESEKETGEARSIFSSSLADHPGDHIHRKKLAWSSCSSSSSSRSSTSLPHHSSTVGVLMSPGSQEGTPFSFSSPCASFSSSPASSSPVEATSHLPGSSGTSFNSDPLSYLSSCQLSRDYLSRRCLSSSSSSRAEDVVSSPSSSSVSVSSLQLDSARTSRSHSTKTCRTGDAAHLIPWKDHLEGGSFHPTGSKSHVSGSSSTTTLATISSSLPALSSSTYSESCTHTHTGLIRPPFSSSSGSPRPSPSSSESPHPSCSSSVCRSPGTPSHFLTCLSSVPCSSSSSACSSSSQMSAVFPSDSLSSQIKGTVSNVARPSPFSSSCVDDVAAKPISFRVESEGSSPLAAPSQLVSSSSEPHHTVLPSSLGSTNTEARADPMIFPSFYPTPSSCLLTSETSRAMSTSPSFISFSPGRGGERHSTDVSTLLSSATAVIQTEGKQSHPFSVSSDMTSHVSGKELLSSLPSASSSSFSPSPVSPPSSSRFTCDASSSVVSSHEECTGAEERGERGKRVFSNMAWSSPCMTSVPATTLHTETRSIRPHAVSPCVSSSPSVSSESSPEKLTFVSPSRSCSSSSFFPSSLQHGHEGDVTSSPRSAGESVHSGSISTSDVVALDRSRCSQKVSQIEDRRVSSVYRNDEDKTQDPLVLLLQPSMRKASALVEEKSCTSLGVADGALPTEEGGGEEEKKEQKAGLVQVSLSQSSRQPSHLHNDEERGFDDKKESDGETYNRGNEKRNPQIIWTPPSTSYETASIGTQSNIMACETSADVRPTLVSFCSYPESQPFPTSVENGIQTRSLRKTPGIATEEVGVDLRLSSHRTAVGSPTSMASLLSSSTDPFKRRSIATSPGDHSLSSASHTSLLLSPSSKDTDFAGSSSFSSSCSTRFIFSPSRSVVDVSVKTGDQEDRHFVSTRKIDDKERRESDPDEIEDYSLSVTMRRVDSSDSMRSNACILSGTERQAFVSSQATLVSVSPWETKIQEEGKLNDRRGDKEDKKDEGHCKEANSLSFRNEGKGEEGHYCDEVDRRSLRDSAPSRGKSEREEGSGDRIVGKSSSSSLHEKGIDKALSLTTDQVEAVIDQEKGFVTLQQYERPHSPGDKNPIEQQVKTRDDTETALEPTKEKGDATICGDERKSGSSLAIHSTRERGSHQSVTVEEKEEKGKERECGDHMACILDKKDECLTQPGSSGCEHLSSLSSSIILHTSTPLKFAGEVFSVVSLNEEPIQSSCQQEQDEERREMFSSLSSPSHNHHQTKPVDLSSPRPLLLSATPSLSSPPSPTHGDNEKENKKRVEEDGDLSKSPHKETTEKAEEDKTQLHSHSEDLFNRETASASSSQLPVVVAERKKEREGLIRLYDELCHYKGGYNSLLEERKMRGSQAPQEREGDDGVYEIDWDQAMLATVNELRNPPLPETEEDWENLMGSSKTLEVDVHMACVGRSNSLISSSLTTRDVLSDDMKDPYGAGETHKEDSSGGSVSKGKDLLYLKKNREALRRRQERRRPPMMMSSPPVEAVVLLLDHKTTKLASRMGRRSRGSERDLEEEREDLSRWKAEKGSVYGEGPFRGSLRQQKHSSSFPIRDTQRLQSHKRTSHRRRRKGRQEAEEETPLPLVMLGGAGDPCAAPFVIVEERILEEQEEEFDQHDSRGLLSSPSSSSLCQETSPSLGSLQNKKAVTLVSGVTSVDQRDSMKSSTSRRKNGEEGREKSEERSGSCEDPSKGDDDKNMMKSQNNQEGEEEKKKLKRKKKRTSKLRILKRRFARLLLESEEPPPPPPIRSGSIRDRGEGGGRATGREMNEGEMRREEGGGRQEKEYSDDNVVAEMSKIRKNEGVPEKSKEREEGFPGSLGGSKSTLVGKENDAPEGPPSSAVNKRISNASLSSSTTSSSSSVASSSFSSSSLPTPVSSSYDILPTASSSPLLPSTTFDSTRTSGFLHFSFITSQLEEAVKQAQKGEKGSVDPRLLQLLDFARTLERKEERPSERVEGRTEIPAEVSAPPLTSPSSPAPSPSVKRVHATEGLATVLTSEKEKMIHDKGSGSCMSEGNRVVHPGERSDRPSLVSERERKNMGPPCVLDEAVEMPGNGEVEKIDKTASDKHSALDPPGEVQAVINREKTQRGGGEGEQEEGERGEHQGVEECFRTSSTSTPEPASQYCVLSGEQQPGGDQQGKEEEKRRLHTTTCRHIPSTPFDRSKGDENMTTTTTLVPNSSFFFSPLYADSCAGSLSPFLFSSPSSRSRYRSIREEPSCLSVKGGHHGKRSVSDTKVDILLRRRECRFLRELLRGFSGRHSDLHIPLPPWLSPPPAKRSSHLSALSMWKEVMTTRGASQGASHSSNTRHVSSGSSSMSAGGTGGGGGSDPSSQMGSAGSKFSEACFLESYYYTDCFYTSLLSSRVLLGNAMNHLTLPSHLLQKKNAMRSGGALGGGIGMGPGGGVGGGMITKYTFSNQGVLQSIKLCSPGGRRGEGMELNVSSSSSHPLTSSSLSSSLSTTSSCSGPTGAGGGRKGLAGVRSSCAGGEDGLLHHRQQQLSPHSHHTSSGSKGVPYTHHPSSHATSPIDNMHIIDPSHHARGDSLHSLIPSPSSSPSAMNYPSHLPSSSSSSKDQQTKQPLPVLHQDSLPGGGSKTRQKSDGSDPSTIQAASAVATAVVIATREIEELSLSIVRGSPDILLLPVVPQQELALQQQLHQLTLCRHLWVQRMDRSLYPPPHLTEKEKVARIVDAPPATHTHLHLTSSSLPSSSTSSIVQHPSKSSGKVSTGGGIGKSGGAVNKEKEVFVAPGYEGMTTRATGGKGETGNSLDEERQGKLGPTRGAGGGIGGGSKVVKGKKVMDKADETHHSPLTTSSRSMDQEGKRGEERRNDVYPEILVPSNLMKETFGLEKLSGNKGYKKLKDPRSGPPSWGMQVWFSLGRRAELEYFLSRYFRDMKEMDHCRKPGHADKNLSSRQEDHEGAPTFDPSSSASLRKEEDDRQQHTPENEKGKTSIQQHADLSPHMKTPTCSPSTSPAEASSPPLQLPSPLTGANSPSDESGDHKGEGEGGGNGKAERRGMEISFSPSPRGVKDSEDALTKIEEKESPKGTGKRVREIQEEKEECKEEQGEGEDEGSPGKKDSQNKTGNTKTKKKEQGKKKEESEEDVLLHPLLLLRIANCEWRVLREFAPDVAETFKSHVRHFKLKRNPYVHTLQQQIDYKLAVMMSLRSPLYRISSPFLEHAKRVIAKHRGLPLPPPLSPSSYLPFQLLTALNLPSSSFGSTVFPSSTPGRGGSHVSGLAQGASSSILPNASSTYHVSSLSSPDRKFDQSTSSVLLSARTGSPGKSHNSLLQIDESNLLLLDKSTTPATPVRPSSSSSSFPSSALVPTTEEEREREGASLDERDQRKERDPIQQEQQLDVVLSSERQQHGSSFGISTVSPGGEVGGGLSSYAHHQGLSAASSSSSPSSGVVLVGSSAPHSLLVSNSPSGLPSPRIDDNRQLVPASHPLTSPATTATTSRQTIGGRQPLRLKVLLLPSNQNNSSSNNAIPGTLINSTTSTSFSSSSSGGSLSSFSLSLRGCGGDLFSTPATGFPSGSKSLMTIVGNGMHSSSSNSSYPRREGLEGRTSLLLSSYPGGQASLMMTTMSEEKDGGRGERDEGKRGGVSERGRWRLRQQGQTAWLREDSSSTSNFMSGEGGETLKVSPMYGYNLTEGEFGIVPDERIRERGTSLEDDRNGRFCQMLEDEGHEYDDPRRRKTRQQCQDLLAVVLSSSSSSSGSTEISYIPSDHDILEVLERLQNQQLTKVLRYLRSLVHRHQTAALMSPEDDQTIHRASLSGGVFSSLSEEQRGQGSTVNLRETSRDRDRYGRSGECEEDRRKEKEEHHEEETKRMKGERLERLSDEKEGSHVVDEIEPVEFDRVWHPWVRLFFPFFSADREQEASAGGKPVERVTKKQSRRERGEQKGKEREEEECAVYGQRKRKFLSEEDSSGEVLRREAFSHLGTSRDFPQFVCGGMNRLRSIRRRRFRVEVRKGTGCLANSFSFTFSSSFSPSSSSSFFPSDGLLSHPLRNHSGEQEKSLVGDSAGRTTRRSSASSLEKPLTVSSQEAFSNSLSSSSSLVLKRHGATGGRNEERGEQLEGLMDGGRDHRVKEEDAGGGKLSKTVAVENGDGGSPPGLKASEEKKTVVCADKKKKVQQAKAGTGGGSGKKTSKSKENEKRSSKSRGGGKGHHHKQSRGLDAIEDEWAAWGLERVGVGGKYYRMIEVEEVFDDELIKTIISPFASAFRRLNSEGFDEIDDEKPCSHVVVREDPSSGASRGFFDTIAPPGDSWAGGGERRLSGSPLAAPSSGGGLLSGSQGMLFETVDHRSSMNYSLQPPSGFFGGGGKGGGSTISLSSHKGDVDVENCLPPKKKMKGAERSSSRCLEEDTGEGRGGVSQADDVVTVQRKAGGSRSGSMHEEEGGEPGVREGGGEQEKRSRRDQLHIEAMLKLFNYKQSVPEKLYPGLRVQFAASLVPGGHVAWWEGVIVSIQEEELAQGTPFGLPVSHFAVPPFPSGEKKRGKPPGLVGLSSSGPQNSKKNRLQTQQQDGEGSSHGNSSTRPPSTASCASKGSHHNNSHSGMATATASGEGEGRGDGGSGEKGAGDNQPSDAETGWVEIVYRVAPGKTKRGCTSLRLFMPPNVPLAEPAEGCWRLRPKTPFSSCCSSESRSLLRSIRDLSDRSVSSPSSSSLSSSIPPASSTNAAAAASHEEEGFLTNQTAASSNTSRLDGDQDPSEGWRTSSTSQETKEKKEEECGGERSSITSAVETRTSLEERPLPGDSTELKSDVGGEKKEDKESSPEGDEEDPSRVVGCVRDSRAEEEEGEKNRKAFKEARDESICKKEESDDPGKEAENDEEKERKRGGERSNSERLPSQSSLESHGDDPSPRGDILSKPEALSSFSSVHSVAEQILLEEREMFDRMKYGYSVSLLSQDVWPGAVVCVCMEENRHELHDALVLNVATTPACCSAAASSRTCGSWSDEEESEERSFMKSSQEEISPHTGGRGNHLPGSSLHPNISKESHNRKERDIGAQTEDVSAAKTAPDKHPSLALSDAKHISSSLQRGGSTPCKAEDREKEQRRFEQLGRQLRCQCSNVDSFPGSLENTATSSSTMMMMRCHESQGFNSLSAGSRDSSVLGGSVEKNTHTEISASFSSSSSYTAPSSRSARSTTSSTSATPMTPSSSSHGGASVSSQTPSSSFQRGYCLEGRRPYQPGHRRARCGHPVRITGVKLLYFADGAVEWISVDVLRYRLSYDIHPQDPSVALATIRPHWVWVIPRYVPPLPPRLVHLQQQLQHCTLLASGTGAGSKQQTAMLLHGGGGEQGGGITGKHPSLISSHSPVMLSCSGVLNSAGGDHHGGGAGEGGGGVDGNTRSSHTCPFMAASTPALSFPQPGAGGMQQQPPPSLPMLTDSSAYPPMGTHTVFSRYLRVVPGNAASARCTLWYIPIDLQLHPACIPPFANIPLSRFPSNLKPSVTTLLRKGKKANVDVDDHPGAGKPRSSQSSPTATMTRGGVSSAMMKGEEEIEARGRGGGGQGYHERKHSQIHSREEKKITKGSGFFHDTRGVVSSRPEASEGMENGEEVSRRNVSEGREEEQQQSREGGEQGDQQGGRTTRGLDQPQGSHERQDKTGGDSRVEEGNVVSHPLGKGIDDSQRISKDTGKKKGKKKSKACASSSSSSKIGRDKASCESSSLSQYPGGEEGEEEKREEEEEEETPIFFAPTICKFLQPDLDPRALLLQNLWSYRWPSMPYFPPHTAPAIGAMISAASSSSLSLSVSSSLSSSSTPHSSYTAGSLPGTPKKVLVFPSGHHNTPPHCITSSTQILSSPRRKRTFRSLESSTVGSSPPLPSPSPTNIPSNGGVISQSENIGVGVECERVLRHRSHLSTSLSDEIQSNDTSINTQRNLRSSSSSVFQEGSSRERNGPSALLGRDSTTTASIPPSSFSSSSPPPSVDESRVTQKRSSRLPTSSGSTAPLTTATPAEGGGGMAAANHPPSTSRLRINLNSLSSRGRGHLLVSQASSTISGASSTASSLHPPPTSSSPSSLEHSCMSSKGDQETHDHHERQVASDTTPHHEPRVVSQGSSPTEDLRGLSDFAEKRDACGNLNKERRDGESLSEKKRKTEKMSIDGCEDRHTSTASAVTTVISQDAQDISGGDRVPCLSGMNSSRVPCSEGSACQEEERQTKDTVVCSSSSISESTSSIDCKELSEGRELRFIQGSRSKVGERSSPSDGEEITSSCKHASRETPREEEDDHAQNTKACGLLESSGDASSIQEDTRGTRGCKSAGGVKRRAQHRDVSKDLSQGGVSAAVETKGARPSPAGGDVQEDEERTSKKIKLSSSIRRSPTASIIVSPHTEKNTTSRPITIDRPDNGASSSSSQLSSASSPSPPRPDNMALRSNRRARSAQKFDGEEDEEVKTLSVKRLMASPAHASNLGPPSNTTETSEGGEEDRGEGEAPTTQSRFHSPRTPSLRQPSSSSLTSTGEQAENTATPGRNTHEDEGEDSSQGNDSRSGEEGGCPTCEDGSSTLTGSSDRPMESSAENGTTRSSSSSSQTTGGGGSTPGFSSVVSHHTTRHKTQKHPHQTRSSTGVGPRPNQALSPYYYVGNPPASPQLSGGGEGASVVSRNPGSTGGFGTSPNELERESPNTTGVAHAGALAPYEVEGGDYGTRFFTSTPTLHWSQLSWSFTEDEKEEEKNGMRGGGGEEEAVDHLEKA